MATMPQSMMQGQSPAMPMSMPQGEEPTQSPGQAVTITKLPDGTFTVGQDDAQGQPVASIDEALNMAKQMLGGGEDRGAIAKQVWST